MTIAAGETILAADVQSIKDDVDKLTDVAGDFVGTTETTASTSFANLSTTGPAVTITTGTIVIVFFSARMSNNTAGESCVAAVDVSGASTVTPNDNFSILFESGNANDQARLGTSVLITGLTAGSNTFTLQYHVTGGTGSFQHRRLHVLPIGA